MSTKGTVIDRNPLHPNALTLDDIHLGRHVVLVNYVDKSMHTYIVMSETYDDGEGGYWFRVQPTLSKDNRRPRELYAEEWGIVPTEEAGWHDFHVVLDPEDCKNGFPELRFVRNPKFDMLRRDMEIIARATGAIS